MSFSLKTLADKKWFVPVIFFLLLIIVISSWRNESNNISEATTEERLKEICMAVCGSENVSVMIFYEDSVSVSAWQNNTEKKIAGVAVVCEGGEDLDIQLKIYEVIKSLFGIPMSRITVTGTL